jgi:hypothetical protein
MATDALLQPQVVEFFDGPYDGAIEMFNFTLQLTLTRRNTLYTLTQRERVGTCLTDRSLAPAYVAAQPESRR